ncbi:MAG: hypothetical protein U5K75_07445 [Ahrensia sp.]|nr:hypothetical protein [Ahrensia sp.]
MRGKLSWTAFLIASLNVGFGHAQDASSSEKVDSVYTQLDLEASCIEYASYELGAAFSCPGYAGFGVLFAEEDLRQSVFYGYVGAWFGEGAWESFSGFNTISGTIEWRLRDRVPFATIHRWLITPEGGDDSSEKGQVLVVSKVAQPGVGEGCVVGYVDALENENANDLAREVADTMAVDFSCRIEEPIFHGNEGVAAGFPVRTFGP